ncbi:MAG TPA: polysaccharide biosynthesis/export family protein [Terriglobia bacterium]|nr:polysaccharide biosynthesis/export family protein [Terriglobia bacterium]
MRTALIVCLIAGIVAIPALAAGKKHDDNQSSQQQRPSLPASPTYVISPGDVLDISVWKEPDISFRGLPVRPDGKISLPLISDVQAAGLTATQLSISITQKLKKFIEDPQVTVVVAAVNSQHYYVLGEVLHAGVFPLLPGMTVLQALSAAGGFTQFADTKKVYILRSVNGAQQKLPFNYKDVVQGKNLQENVRLKPGDTIIVP